VIIMTRPLLVALGLAGALALGAPVALAGPGDRIQGEIQSALPAELSVVELRVPRPLEHIGDAPIQIDWRRPARTGWLTLRVTAGAKSGWVRARLAQVIPVVIATRALPPGHVIGPDDVAVEARAVDRRGAALLGVEAAIGRTVRVAVGAGAAVPPGALERSAPLPRGHLVKAVVKRGGLTISTAGALERPASIGAATSVRLRSTGRVVQGRLIDSATVLLEMHP
jgi:flagella basal body P-ring formation protein FlgA